MRGGVEILLHERCKLAAPTQIFRVVPLHSTHIQLHVFILQSVVMLSKYTAFASYGGSWSKPQIAHFHQNHARIQPPCFPLGNRFDRVAKMLSSIWIILTVLRSKPYNNPNTSNLRNLIAMYARKTCTCAKVDVNSMIVKIGIIDGFWKIGL